MTQKLTPEQWQEVKDKIQLYNIPIPTIAKEYNISRQAIFLYFQRHNWEMKPKSFSIKQKLMKIWNIMNN
jgi:predicted DNA-binding protein YlxM (UPF0122 family)